MATASSTASHRISISLGPVRSGERTSARTGALLLRAAAELARDFGAVRLKLSTEITNPSAQRLYTTLGWKRHEDFYEYGMSL